MGRSVFPSLIWTISPLSRGVGAWPHEHHRHRLVCWGRNYAVRLVVHVLAPSGGGSSRCARGSSSWGPGLGLGLDLVLRVGVAAFNNAFLPY